MQRYTRGFQCAGDEEETQGQYYPTTKVKEVAEGRCAKIEEEGKCPTEEETKERYKN